MTGIWPPITLERETREELHYQKILKKVSGKKKKKEDTEESDTLTTPKRQATTTVYCRAGGGATAFGKRKYATRVDKNIDARRAPAQVTAVRPPIFQATSHTIVE